jgi:hypothetical protein
MNLNHHFVLKAVAIILLPIAILSVVAWGLGFEFRAQVDLASFTTIPLLLLAILQLYRTQRTQQAASIKEFLNEFRKDDELYTIYFDLVYLYRNQLHDDMRKCVDGKTAGQLPDFSPFERMQDGREVGRRLYLPAWFTLSPEERRLDALFDYFNTLGFYYREGLVSMRDIARILGDYLAVLTQRSIVWHYLQHCQESQNSKVLQVSRAAEPFWYVSLLLNEFAAYNDKATARREINSLKRRIETLKEKGQGVQHGSFTS